MKRASRANRSGANDTWNCDPGGVNGVTTQWAAVRNIVGAMRLPVHQRSWPLMTPSALRSNMRAPTLPNSAPVGVPLMMKFGGSGTDGETARSSHAATAKAKSTTQRMAGLLKRTLGICSAAGPAANAPSRSRLRRGCRDRATLRAPCTTLGHDPVSECTIPETVRRRSPDVSGTNPSTFRMETWSHGWHAGCMGETPDIDEDCVLDRQMTNTVIDQRPPPRWRRPPLACPEVPASVAPSGVRPRVGGKFLFVGDEKLYVKGVTYGSFRPDAEGNEYTNVDVIERDFAQMAAAGITVVRVPHTMPPRSLLDAAQRHGLHVMVGLSAEQYIGYVIDKRRDLDIEAELRGRVRTVAGHPALLCYALGNEIPAHLSRWYGRRRVERYLERLYRVVKTEDPEGLVTYVNYPSTEYLDLSFLDLVCYNVYLEKREALEAYVARLQNVAGDRPLILSEVGLDALRNGEDRQAESIEWQIRSAFAGGCAGVFVFAWTDEWHRAGLQVEDWAFGITDRHRGPKPALAAVRNAFRDVPFGPEAWPPVSVVVCTYNGSRVIRDCLEGLSRLDYPDFEAIVVDDGSTDRTADIVGEYDVRLIRTENRGLSSARNTGLEAARGEIVAYLDDDAYPDPHWLRYLAWAFRTSDHAGIGGPNIPPPGDGPIADCVANAPGGPVHVLLSDREAEHIPGCNMAFRKDRLEALGGLV